MTTANQPTPAQIMPPALASWADRIACSNPVAISADRLTYWKAAVETLATRIEANDAAEAGETVTAWIADTVRNSVLSRDAATWNEITAALPALLTALTPVAERGTPPASGAAMTATARSE